MISDNTQSPPFPSIENSVLVSQISHDDGITDSQGHVSPEILKRKPGDVAVDCQNDADTTDLDSIGTKRLRLDQQNDGSTARELACPFFKKNCHNAATHKACSGPGWTSISRLKEHISRCHKLKNQCNRCREVFGTALELATHQRNSESCPLLETPLLETITAEQEAQLRYHGGKRMKCSNEEKWKNVYQILFPGDDSVPSPYYGEPCGECISQVRSRLLDDYRHYQLRELAPLLKQELAVINNMTRELRSQIAELLPRLSIKVLNDFQDNHRMDFWGKEPIACSSQQMNGLADTECETVQSSPGQEMHSLEDLRTFCYGSTDNADQVATDFI
ncbi:hypothetical protein F4680DRAFT_242504 [Xylaria scruposa]|nr:hypothetical protein F4680DRAFT_242504 [Xylaria scruposa]